MICELCKNEYANMISLCSHLVNTHKDVSKEEYYNSYLKTDKSNSGICLTCNNKTTFLGPGKGYRLYCSNSCAQKSPVVQSKSRTTYFERTGFEHNSLNPESMNRMKETNKERNGGILFFQRPDVIREMKIKKIEKFGNANNYEKIKQTNIEKYGVDNSSKRPEVIEKIMGNSFINAKTNFLNMLTSARACGFVNFRFGSRQTLNCKLCNKDFNIHFSTLKRRIEENTTICTMCNPLYQTSSKSEMENELFEFIKSLNIGCERTNKIILNNKFELDIFIPSKNIAIEFNGVYWHSELYKSNDYHLKKTEECESKGIHLIHIYEDDWLYKRDIVESRLKSILGSSDERIFARKCIIKDLTNIETKDFLSMNHIQGFTNAKYRYGLFYNDELVACMTFGASRFEKNKMELHRFANKLDSNVVGGASRLFKYFLNTVNPIEIISYADRSWSQGKLYETLGFKLIAKTKPNYAYVINGIREQRFKYKKSDLIKEGFDSSKTEVEIMNDRGYYRIYDSGNLKYEYKKSN